MALFTFDKVINTAQFTLPDNQEFQLSLGITTLVNWTSDRSLTFVGLLNAAAIGNIDGLVVLFSNLNNNSNTLSFLNESGLASAATNRFRLASGVTSGGTGAGGMMFRYHGTVQRWLHLATT
jgi:hypothetical protein